MQILTNLDSYKPGYWMITTTIQINNNKVSHKEIISEKDLLLDSFLDLVLIKHNQILKDQIKRKFKGKDEH